MTAFMLLHAIHRQKLWIPALHERNEFFAHGTAQVTATNAASHFWNQGCERTSLEDI